MMPIILNSAEPMVRVRVITTKDRSERALKTLHSMGVLHVEESDELEPMDRAAIERQRREVAELAACIDGVIGYIPAAERVSLGEGVEAIYARPFSDLEHEVLSLCERLNAVHRKTVGPAEELARVSGLKRRLGPLAAHTDLRLRDLDFSGKYLSARCVTLPARAFEPTYQQLKGHLLADTVAPGDDETTVYAIARTQERDFIESTVVDAGGTVLALPDEDLTLGEFLDRAEGTIARLEEEVRFLSQELQGRVRENLERICLLEAVLAAEDERLAVLEKACQARYVNLIAGWIPESAINATIAEIKDSVGYAFIDTREPTPQEEPPTKLKNPRGLKPFQVITNLFGSPGYREWDPTPIVAYSFAIFYGLMLCDVVYAIGVILVTRFLLRIFVDDPTTEGYRLFQRVLYISSGVALVCGLLTGTYLGDVYHFFGVEDLALAASVRGVLGNPISFIILALGLGVVHVNIAHALALAKGIKDRKRGVVVNRIGLFTLQLAGIPLILSWLFDVTLPVGAVVYDVFMYALLASFLVVVVSAFMQHGGLGAIFWLFDITGIFGDVMSYARLAGVGLATFYLASSFNMLAELFAGLIPGAVGAVIGVIIAIVVLIFGHAINLVLSGLTAFIHSLRLCFVEFLFKFYEGGGREYSPFRLKTPASVVVGGK